MWFASDNERLMCSVCTNMCVLDNQRVFAACFSSAREENSSQWTTNMTFVGFDNAKRLVVSYTRLVVYHSAVIKILESVQFQIFSLSRSFLSSLSLSRTYSIPHDARTEFTITATHIVYGLLSAVHAACVRFCYSRSRHTDVFGQFEKCQLNFRPNSIAYA